MSATIDNLKTHIPICFREIYKCLYSSKQIRSFFIFIALLFATSVTVADSEPSRPTIVINTAGEEPLSNSNQTGIMDQLASELFRRVGYKLVLETLPAERALRHANKGLIDGELARIEGIEKLYPNLMRVPEKFINWYFVAYSKLQLDLHQGWKSLNKQNIAYIKGWKIYEKNIPRTALTTEVRNAEQLFTLLTRNRTDIALYNRISGDYMVNKLKLNDVAVQLPPLAVKELFIYLNRKHSRLVPKVAKALSEMKADGTYDRILKTATKHAELY